MEACRAIDRMTVTVVGERARPNSYGAGVAYMTEASPASRPSKRPMCTRPGSFIFVVNGVIV